MAASAARARKVFGVLAEYPECDYCHQRNHDTKKWQFESMAGTLEFLNILFCRRCVIKWLDQWPSDIMQWKLDKDDVLRRPKGEGEQYKGDLFRPKRK